MTDAAEVPVEPVKDIRYGVAAFLQLAFEDPEKPFRTQREMRDEALRQVGWAQAQEALRHVLTQVGEQELSETRNDKQLKPMKGPGDMNMWVPPEYPVRRR